MIRRVGTALPLAPDADDGDDRRWLCYLECGHEAVVIGARGKRPRGHLVECALCIDTPPADVIP